MRFLNVVGIFPDRIDFMVSEAKRLRRESGIDEVALNLTLHPQGKPAIDKPLLYKKVFREYKQKLEGSGVKVGVLFQSLIGHGWTGGACCEENWRRAENIKQTPVDRMCILDEGYREYIRQTVRMIAEEKPCSLLVDDDFRQINGAGLECFCPAHMEQFNAGRHTALSADELREAVRTAKPGDPVLARFETLRKENLLNLARLVRSAIDEADPEIRCGYCTPGAEFLLASDVAKILAGKTKPFVRLCNALYMEGSAKALSYNVYKSFALRAMMPEIEEVIDEADTFPQHRYSKSAKSMHTKLVSAALNGECGAKLWLTNLSTPDPYTERKYDEILAKHQALYPALRNIMKTARPAGAVTVLPSAGHFDHVWHPLHAEDCFYRTDWNFQLLGFYGIPGCYSDMKQQGIRLLSGDMLRFLDDSDLATMLSGKLLVDGSAAIGLARRGFSADLGVNVEEKPFRVTGEVIRKTGETVPFMNDFTAPFLTPASEKTQVFSDLVFERFRKAGDETTLSCGTTLFDNARGGRVAVWCQKLEMPNYLQNPKRRRQLIDLLEQLNGAPLDVYVECDQDVLARQFSLPDGSMMLAVFNLNFDELEEIDLRCAKEPQSIEFLDADGVWKPAPRDGTKIRMPLHTYEYAILKIR